MIANTARGPLLQLAHASRVLRANVVDDGIAIDTQRGAYVSVTGIAKLSCCLR